MRLHRSGRLVAMLAAALAGCAHAAGAPGQRASSVDAVCDVRNATSLRAPLDTIAAGPARFLVERGWASNASSGPTVSLRRVNAHLLATDQSAGAFAPLNRTTIDLGRCTLARGDTSIIVTTHRGISTDFATDVWWETPTESPILRMRLETNSVEQLRKLRGTIESVRFPVDTAAASARRTKRE